MEKFDLTKPLNVYPQMYTNKHLSKMEANVLGMLILRIHRKVSFKRLSDLMGYSIKDIEKTLIDLEEKEYIVIDENNSIMIDFYKLES